MREESRQVYLERREADKLAELEQEVKDEEYLWEGVKLTDYERARIEQKKKTLENRLQGIRNTKTYCNEEATRKHNAQKHSNENTLQ